MILDITRCAYGQSSRVLCQRQLGGHFHSFHPGTKCQHFIFPDIFPPLAMLAQDIVMERKTLLSYSEEGGSIRIPPIYC